MNRGLSYDFCSVSVKAPLLISQPSELRAFYPADQITTGQRKEAMRKRLLTIGLSSVNECLYLLEAENVFMPIITFQDPAKVETKRFCSTLSLCCQARGG